jgi:hypothetical protein
MSDTAASESLVVPFAGDTRCSASMVRAPEEGGWTNTGGVLSYYRN